MTRIIKGLRELRRMFVITGPAFIVLLLVVVPIARVLEGETILWLGIYPPLIIFAAWFMGADDGE